VEKQTTEMRIMNGIPNRAKVFVTACAVTALAMAACAAANRPTVGTKEFLVLLVIAVFASRLKLRLPGLNGNMSVNVPFILVAFTQLNLTEALLVACASGFAQCLPKQGSKQTPVQVLFNVCTMAIASGLASFVIRNGSGWRALVSSGPTVLAIAAAVYFLTNTLSVATIIALSERTKMLSAWSSIFHLSFPYYVASAGIGSMVIAASRHVGWQIPVLGLPVMYAIYRCYRLYFGRIVAMTRAAGLIGLERQAVAMELTFTKTV
jgi:hypothetical protein